MIQEWQDFAQPSGAKSQLCFSFSTMGILIAVLNRDLLCAECLLSCKLLNPTENNPYKLSWRYLARDKSPHVLLNMKQSTKLFLIYICLFYKPLPLMHRQWCLVDGRHCLCKFWEIDWFETWFDCTEKTIKDLDYWRCVILDQRSHSISAHGEFSNNSHCPSATGVACEEG